MKADVEFSERKSAPRGGTARSGAASGDKPGEPALVTALFSRRMAEPLAKAAVRLGMSADAVTVTGGLCWVLSLAVAPAAGLASWDRPSLASGLWALAAVFWCIGYELDVVDGSVARMTRSSSRAGFFLDAVFHALFKPYFLASIGIGLAFASAGADECGSGRGFLAFLALALLSIPANGAATTFGAEIALCEDVALGRLRPDGAANPALWLGSAEVAGSAASKRTSWRRAVATLVRETFSYYLQAPFFALPVVADLVLAGRWSGMNQFVRFFGSMPFTALCFVALALALAVRIPVRWVRDSRRLGRRVSLFRTSPIHMRYARHSLARLFFPALAVAAGLGLWLCWVCRAPASMSPWAGFFLVLAPFLVGGPAFGAEKATAAHVLCEEVGKGRLKPGPLADSLFCAFFDKSHLRRRTVGSALRRMNPVARVRDARSAFLSPFQPH